MKLWLAVQSPREGFMFLARRPSRETIDRFLLDSQDLPLSYRPVGIVITETARQGVDEARDLWIARFQRRQRSVFTCGRLSGSDRSIVCALAAARVN